MAGASAPGQSGEDRKRGSSLTLLAGGLCLVFLAACGDRKPAAEDPASAPPSAAADAAVDASAHAGAGVAPGAVPQGVPPAPAAVVRSGHADRVAPPDVPPVERDGVRYAQAPDGRSLGWKQVGGVLEATEAATGKRLWSLPVYTREVDPGLEADVQWKFFKSMRFAPGGELLIENESGEKYLVDVKKKTSIPAPR